MDADRTWRWPITGPYDFVETTRLLRTGRNDPTVVREPDGLWRTARTDDGPVTVRFVLERDAVVAHAWGPGADAVGPHLPRWIGLHEAPWSLSGHPVVERLQREHAGVRGTDTHDVFEALVNAILQQLVTWNEAAMTWRRLCEGLGEPAPGPRDLLVYPSPRAIRAAGISHLQKAGIGRKRAETIIEVARVARRLQLAADLPTDEALHRLQLVRGVGPWTANLVCGMRLGRPEPIPVGDLHMPNTVVFALTGAHRGTEEQMLALLAPFDGQAFRVIRLLFAARIQAPRRGPRRDFRRPGR
jgi:3-methyladenine DNA glycosylase/8-oxoguanine DNA glycosylase